MSMPALLPNVLEGVRCESGSCICFGSGDDGSPMRRDDAYILRSWSVGLRLVCSRDLSVFELLYGLGRQMPKTRVRAPFQPAKLNEPTKTTCVFWVSE